MYIMKRNSVICTAESKDVVLTRSLTQKHQIKTNFVLRSIFFDAIQSIGFPTHFPSTDVAYYHFVPCRFAKSGLVLPPPPVNKSLYIILETYSTLLLDTRMLKRC